MDERDKAKLDLVRQWLEKAEKDFHVARHLAAERHSYCEAIAFHSPNHCAERSGILTSIQSRATSRWDPSQLSFYPLICSMKALLADYPNPHCRACIASDYWIRLARIRRSRNAPSYDDQRHLGSNSFQVVGVAGDDRLAGSLGTNHDLRVDNIGCRGSCQQEPYGSRIPGAECDEIGARLSDESRKARLSGRIADGLSQGRRRNCNSLTPLRRSRQ